MPRRVQDIVPNTHRSIRDIPVERNSIAAPVQPPKEKESTRSRVRPADVRTAPREKPARPVRVSRASEDDEETLQTIRESQTAVEPVKPPVSVPRSRTKRKIPIWLILLVGIIVVVAGIGYSASVYFSKATFVIVPRSVPLTVNGTYIAQNAATKTGLTYELALVKGTSSVSVPATDGPQQSSTAKGKITLYNSYGTQSQRLIAGTRLSSQDGHIYRLSSSVVVPGSTVSGGKALPGTIAASVTADQPGQAYNLAKADSTDLKIVAYKGSDKYDAIYGKVTSDITGGFVGVKKTVDPKTLASTTAQLQVRITSSLLNEVQGTLPEGYILYPTAYVTSFAPPIVGGTDPKSATITVNGTLYGLIFKKSDLIARIAGNETLAQFEGFTYDSPGLSTLDLSIVNAKDFSPEKKNTLIVKLKGDMSLVGSVPVEELKKKLAGLSLADTAAVLKAYKPIIDIDRSSGEVTPPWAKVPNDTARITLTGLTE